METSDTGVVAQKRLLDLSRKRLERFVILVPKFLLNDEPDFVHDLRVWSRRLQQTMRVVVPESPPRASRKLIKMLRRVRRALGPLRNLDVNAQLVRRRLEEAPSPVLHDAWEQLKNNLQQQRGTLLAEARDAVAENDFIAFIARAQKVLSQADIDANPTGSLEAAVIASLSDWDQAHSLAAESRSVDNLHGLRIATKRLRYRAELAADIGAASLRPLVKDLKEIQAALGDWHDRSVLLQCTAEFIGQPEFLANHPGMGAALLAHMEDEKKDNERAIDEVLQQVPKLRKRLSDWRDKHEES
jgi:CHAD domain-containing protein